MTTSSSTNESSYAKDNPNLHGGIRYAVIASISLHIGMYIDIYVYMWLYVCMYVSMDVCMYGIIALEGNRLLRILEHTPACLST